jgi:cytochrome o ubiquinol oxidase subunit 2
MVSVGTLRAFKRPIGRIAPLSLLALGGCGMQVLDPAGDVAAQQAHILIVSTILMLIIIIPVMALTVFFAWRYRASSKTAEHRPGWDHSTELELVIWSAPLLIIIMLGAITWTSTHMLDPYRRLGRIAPGQAVAKDAKPLEIQVVSLDWKWLFIYPEQGIATVNQLVLPINREVRFRITSSSVMNSFYIPALAGQIYSMPGMETKLHAVLNKTGKFEGFSANYSGAGFSGMHFAVGGVNEAGFEHWVQQTRSNAGLLDRRAYLVLAKPSENVPAKRWSSVEPALFDRIVNQCVAAGQTCMIDTMKKDMGTMDMGGAPMGATPPVADTAHANGGGAKGALLRSPKEQPASTRPGAPTPNTPASDR